MPKLNQPTPDPFAAHRLTRSIAPARDRFQSNILVWTVLPILCTIGLVRTAGLMLYAPRLQTLVIASVCISISFAVLAWRLKAATPAASFAGGVICLCLIYGTHINAKSVVHSAIVPLVALFGLTFLATRAGRRRKAERGLAESRSGRITSQIVANLGCAALFSTPLGLTVIYLIWPNSSPLPSSVAISVCTLAALAQATADTVSSEIGQAFGGIPCLLTTLRRVPPGTDGAISLTGTLAGIAAAALIAATGVPALGMSLTQGTIAFAAGVAGLFFDSILGATIERRGYLANDLVNFTSTTFAAAIALLAIRLGWDHLTR